VTLTDHDLSELLAALRAGEVTDTIRTSLEWILQQLIEAEATAVIGAARHERSEGRTAVRNGHRPRLLSTPAGDVELGIPKLREGSFFPSLLERINGEVKRRTRVVGIFPNDASALRLITAVIVETHDEWAVAERRYLSEESMAKLFAPEDDAAQQELPLAAITA
jgi:transposase-like protein